jgi:propionyl-CoA carboxylase alpha chain
VTTQRKSTTMPTPIRTLLIANRGEIACRIMRTAAAMGIRTVAVYSEPDARSRHVGTADSAVALGGRTSSESYLDAGKILAAANGTGVDAIHPGYGFLAENAEFAQACAGAGIVFVGPSPESIRDMGLKDRAKQLAREAGIPVLVDAVITGDDVTEWVAAARDVGYPLMVKAVAGGGGKGMRLVASEIELESAVATARREAASSFGNNTVFLEQFLPAPRHIEIQVVADNYGKSVHLLDRECSIQRRHQKIIEEAPSPSISAELRQTIGATSLALVNALGYRGVGTIEYLFDENSGRYYFLEMNTRLQVEHPVTEEITGLDLVQLQLDIAAGYPLLLEQKEIRANGHAIEARLCAEDPGADFLPTPGEILHYAHPQLPGVRYEDGLTAPSEVSSYYDPLIAKVVAHGRSRDEATARLSAALGRLEVHGTRTNRDYLRAILDHQDFLSARTTTNFVGEHPGLLDAPDVDQERHLAAALAVQIVAAQSRLPMAAVSPVGWRPIPGAPATNEKWKRIDGSFDGEVSLRARVRDSELVIELGVNGAARTFRVDTSNHPELDVRDTDITARLNAHDYPNGQIWLNDGRYQSGWLKYDPFPDPDSVADAGALTVLMPGTVVGIDVVAGDLVEPGQRLLTVEAMKMEHVLKATSAGRITDVYVTMGQYVDPGTTLIAIEETA